MFWHVLSPPATLLVSFNADHVKTKVLRVPGLENRMEYDIGTTSGSPQALVPDPKLESTKIYKA